MGRRGRRALTQDEKCGRKDEKCGHADADTQGALHPVDLAGAGEHHERPRPDRHELDMPDEPTLTVPLQPSPRETFGNESAGLHHLRYEPGKQFLNVTFSWVSLLGSPCVAVPPVLLSPYCSRMVT